MTELERYWKERDFVPELLDHLPDYVFWKDINSVFLGCNTHFAKSCGLESSKDIIGKTDYDLPWKKSESDTYRADDKQVMETQTPKLNIEEPQTLSDGTKITLLTSKVPLLDNKKKVIGVLCIYRDITDRKKLEKNLHQSKKIAETASQAKSAFIANMSHDLRTPITGILGLAQYFFDEANTPYMKESAQYLLSTTNELLDLLNEMIEAVEIESGNLKVTEKDFPLKELVERNVNLIKPTLHYKKVTLSTYVADDIPKWLFGNKNYLDRILLNLLGNAVKFTERGQISLAIETLIQEEDKVTLKIMIKDSGIGIPKDKQEAIFDSFYKISSSCDSDYRGSGMGLFIVKQYLKNVDGIITVDSEPGVGSTFTITMPFKFSKQSDRPAPTKNHTLQDPNLEIDPHLESILATALIVEDNVLVARMTKQQLEKMGCQSDIAGTGEMALDMIDKNIYDFILMDIGLPGIDGFETTKAIRAKKQKTTSETPIIALTGHLLKNKNQECLDTGMQAMITKPLKLTDIENILKKFVKLKQMTDSDIKFTSLDLKQGIALADNNKALAYEALHMLGESLPNTLKQLRRTPHDQYDKLSKIIHNLYSSLCYAGAPKLLEIHATLSEAILSKNQKRTAEKMSSLFDEAESVLQEIKQLSKLTS